MGQKKKFHPTLVAEILDAVAFASTPISSSELSVKITVAMRKLVDKGIVTNDDVMTRNTSDAAIGAGWYEVTGATISRILDGLDEIVMTGVAHGKRHYATRVNVDRWAREREIRELAVVEADDRFEIQHNVVHGYVRVIDRTKVGHVSTPAETAVATFDTDVVPTDVALDLAAKVKRALVVSAAKSAVA